MNILYATDGSEGATTAGRLLARLPLPAGTRVTVLCAVPESTWLATPPLGAEASVYPQVVELAAEEEAAALRAAEAGAALLREHGVTVITAMRRLNPVDAILEQAREDGAGLIVVGSHGMGAVERFLLGSVSERVARYAHCPVLVARGDTLRRAIVAVDGSESAEHALDALAELPLPSEVEWTAVHVIRPTDLAPPMPYIPGLTWNMVLEQYEEERRTAGERILHHAQEHLRAEGRQAGTEVRLGTPADELVAAARETGADLIVVGAANRSALGRLFLGSVSSRVLTHVPCSVLVARTEDGEGERQRAE
jgi:nucleotide-binding universal stress UspA family protein